MVQIQLAATQGRPTQARTRFFRPPPRAIHITPRCTQHNHPSGDANPSEADIRVTRELIRAGQVLKIEVLDHVIVGRENHRSLRELGYFS